MLTFTIWLVIAVNGQQSWTPMPNSPRFSSHEECLKALPQYAASHPDGAVCGPAGKTMRPMEPDSK